MNEEDEEIEEVDAEESDYDEEEDDEDDEEEEEEDEDFNYVSNKSSEYYLSRNRNENLKLKMMSEIKKSKKKNSKSCEQTSGATESEITDTNAAAAESNSPTEDTVSNPNRRLSYKEDDILRKQRLKENLNQLLIEYKHEEEAAAKKSSKVNNANNAQTKSGRASLDSAKLAKTNSAFSLVIPPQQVSNAYTTIGNSSSAFRPIVLSDPLSIKSNKPTPPGKNPTNQSPSSSSESSWSSASSSNSPPKTRQSNAAPVTPVSINDIKTIPSPRHENFSKSLTIVVRNNSLDDPNTSDEFQKVNFNTYNLNLR